MVTRPDARRHWPADARRMTMGPRPEGRRKEVLVMELVITLGLVGWAILIVGSLVFGGIAQVVGETRAGYEWLVDAIAAGIGALIASEFIVAWQALGPVVDGLALVPALVGGLVVGLVVEIATRLITGGRYTHGAMSA
jgi:uncharacterized membrane protein YeaQ/YmgE (transglycosylase-associated protein family)